MKEHRRFGLNQLTGFIMMGAALTLLVRPMSAVLSDGQIYIAMITFFVFGYLLAWRRNSGDAEFFVATVPILGLSTLYLTYVVANSNSSLIPSFLMACLFLVLQYCHGRQEEWRKWMKL